MDQSRPSIPFGTFGENRYVSKRLMKKAARASFRVRADASEGVVREKRWMRVARKGKSAISCGHRETVCRSQERNTIGGDIDLPWELPCATSWRSYARATSRFFFRDSNASRRRRRHRRLAVFPPLFSVVSHHQTSRGFRLSLHLSESSPTRSVTSDTCHCFRFIPFPDPPSGTAGVI